MDKELELLGKIVDRAVAFREGTFSQRNPALGKMVRCSHCGRRRRQNAAVPCCTAKYSIVTGENKPRPRPVDSDRPPKGRKNPRLTRNQPPLFEVHQRLVEKEQSELYQEYPGVSGIIEAQIVRRNKAKARGLRNHQKKSRAINRKSK